MRITPAAASTNAEYLNGKMCTLCTDISISVRIKTNTSRHAPARLTIGVRWVDYTKQQHRAVSHTPKDAHIWRLLCVLLVCCGCSLPPYMRVFWSAVAAPCILCSSSPLWLLLAFCAPLPLCGLLWLLLAFCAPLPLCGCSLHSVLLFPSVAAPCILCSSSPLWSVQGCLRDACLHTLEETGRIVAH